jgi:hypothetical protein
MSARRRRHNEDPQLQRGLSAIRDGRHKNIFDVRYIDPVIGKNVISVIIYFTVFDTQVSDQVAQILILDHYSYILLLANA